MTQTTTAPSTPATAGSVRPLALAVVGAAAANVVP